MRYLSMFSSTVRWLLLATFLSVGLAGVASAQQEPTMDQVYSTAKAGKLDQAQVMIQQVLVAHPKSAKAHYVQSELYARQGNLSKARDALSQAQSLAPGLPFAKPEAVAALEQQLVARPVAKSTPAVSNYGTAATNPSSPASGSWLLPALLAVGVIGAAYFIFRRKTAQSYDQGPANYANRNGLSGPQSFGNGGMPGGMQPGMQGGYGQQPGYGQPGYGQPAGGGLGGRIMGGVATGLAVGAGVVAAEAIGRSMMGNHDTGSRSNSDNAANTGNGSGSYEPLSGNTDMGGQDFGISDTSWDDGGGSSDAGGGGWDN